MNDNQNSRIRNILINGPGILRDEKASDDAQWEETEYIEDPAVPEAEEAVEEPAPAVEDSKIMVELEEIREMVREIGSRDISQYMTTKEQVKKMTEAISKMESSSSNKALVRAMEQISTMREDFFRLCEGMRERIDEMDARTVLSSFEAYEVDMENILVDAGVYIGEFDLGKLNTLHQRIVGVVPTGEKEKDGTIAERLSSGYKLGDKVLVKEKVTVHKFDPALAEEAQVETGFQTASETVSESEGSEDADPAGNMEEKE